jgi:hypothetical protein
LRAGVEIVGIENPVFYIVVLSRCAGGYVYLAGANPVLEEINSRAGIELCIGLSRKGSAQDEKSHGN